MTAPKLSYSVLEAAAAIGVDPVTIRRAIKAGDLAAKLSSRRRKSSENRGGPKVLIPAAELQRWLSDLPNFDDAADAS